jgi:hypothetical protein
LKKDSIKRLFDQKKEGSLDKSPQVCSLLSIFFTPS